VLWDDEKEWRVGDLHQDQVRLSVRENWYLAMLVSRMVKDGCQRTRLPRQTDAASGFRTTNRQDHSPTHRVSSMTSTRKRPKIGDILEIATPAGLGYVQYTHNNAMMGALVRVLPGLYTARPDDLASLAARSERFFVFIAVGLLTHRGVVPIIGNVPVPAHAVPFPMFKMGGPHDWWLWNGEREWRVGELRPEQRTFSPRAVWGLALLASRMAHGWAPDDEAAGPN
jgi:hypothetical protein